MIYQGQFKCVAKEVHLNIFPRGRGPKGDAGLIKEGFLLKLSAMLRGFKEG